MLTFIMKNTTGDWIVSFCKSSGKELQDSLQLCFLYSISTVNCQNDKMWDHLHIQIQLSSTLRVAELLLYMRGSSLQLHESQYMIPLLTKGTSLLTVLGREKSYIQDEPTPLCTGSGTIGCHLPYFIDPLSDDTEILGLQVDSNFHESLVFRVGPQKETFSYFIYPCSITSGTGIP